MEKKVLLEKGGIYEDDDVENIIEQPQEWTLNMPNLHGNHYFLIKICM